MNCNNDRTNQKVGVAAFALTMLVLFILTTGAALPLQAQVIEEKPLASVSWTQTGYNAAHVGYNPKEKTLSKTNVSGLTQTWLFPTSAEINVPSVTSGSRCW